MEISIVIPALNASETISQQLSALAEQSWQEEYEVIVVDNGSNDQTVDVIQSYNSSIKNLKVIEAKAKRGAGYARNIGAEQACGDFLLFCDADDVVDSRWVEEMVIALKKYSFVCSRLNFSRLNNQTIQNSRYCIQQNGVIQNDNPPYFTHAATSGLGVRKELHESVGGFDESFYTCEDADYCWRIQLAGVSLYFVESALVHYRFRETIQDTCKQALRWGIDSTKLYRKHQALGMPKISIRKGLGRWLFLIKNVHALCNEDKRGKWLWKFYMSLGRLIGYIKYKVIAI